MARLPPLPQVDSIGNHSRRAGGASWRPRRRLRGSRRAAHRHHRRTISFEAYADGQDEDAARAMIPSAINLPAQTFYPTLPVMGELLKK